MSPAMRAAVQALTDGHTEFEVVICQIVRILKPACGAHVQARGHFRHIARFAG